MDNKNLLKVRFNKTISRQTLLLFLPMVLLIYLVFYAITHDFTALNTLPALLLTAPLVILALGVAYFIAQRNYQLLSLRQEYDSLSEVVSQELLKNNGLTVELEKQRVLSDQVQSDYPEFSVQIDIHGLMTQGSKNIADITGYTMAELFNRSVDEILPGLTGIIPKIFPRNCQETRPEWIGDKKNFHIQHRNGKFIPCLINYFPSIENGLPQWFLGISDISEKQTTAQYNQETVTKHPPAWLLQQAKQVFDERAQLIRESQQYFQRLVENISDVFWLVTPDWNNVLYASPSYEKLWGRPRQTLYANSLVWIDYLHHKDQRKIRNAIERFSRQKLRVYDFPEFRVIRPDGRDCWMKAHGYPIFDQNNQVYQIVLIAVDITLYKEAEIKILSSEKQRVENDRNTVEEERKRLGQELHDEIGQMLTALNINLELLRRRLKSDNDASQKPLKVASEITRELMQSVRNIVHDLRPPQLDDLGLIAALRWYLKNMRQTSMLTFNMTENLGNVRLPKDIELNSFRIIQEAITNTLRHADASTVDIVLEYSGIDLILQIRDDGVGFETEKVIYPDVNTDQTGLRSIRERTTSMHGKFRIQAAPEKGCFIQIKINLKDIKDGA